MLVCEVLRALFGSVFSIFWINSAIAATLFSNALADGSISDAQTGFSSYNLNGNCGFHCESQFDREFAENFSLQRDSEIESISFVGIRTGDPVDLSFSLSLNVSIYEATSVFDNTGSPNYDLGSLVYESSNVIAEQTSILTGLASPHTFIDFTLDISDVFLSSGDYWISFDGDVSGWSGASDDTALYWAFGYGDGIWASSDQLNVWRNPNPDLLLGRLNFSLNGRELCNDRDTPPTGDGVPPRCAPPGVVPLPASLPLMLGALAGLGFLMRARRQA